MKADGSVLPFITQPTSSAALWGFSAVNHADARMLVAVVHGTHRLVSLMQELHRTGCASLRLVPSLHYRRPRASGFLIFFFFFGVRLNAYACVLGVDPHDWCRQDGMISDTCMEVLARRAESLHEPEWFMEFERPVEYPAVAAPGTPQLPFTIIGVATALETEAVYYSAIRNLPKYMAAFGLHQLQPVADEDLVPEHDIVHGKEHVVHMTGVRSSRFLWRSVLSNACTVYGPCLRALVCLRLVRVA